MKEDINKQVFLFFLCFSYVKTDDNMVLLWRAAGPQTNSYVYDGTGDILIFLFYFENVVMSGENQEDKFIYLIGKLDGESLQVLFNNFPKDGELTDEGKYFLIVNTSLLKMFGRGKYPQQIIRKAPEAFLESQNFLRSTENL